jgi:hypothetical protein
MRNHDRNFFDVPQIIPFCVGFQKIQAIGFSKTISPFSGHRCFSNLPKFFYPHFAIIEENQVKRKNLDLETIIRSEQKKSKPIFGRPAFFFSSMVFYIVISETVMFRVG